jgi:hypothetical protein
MNHPRVKHVKKVVHNPNCVYVGRPTKWGNPFTIGKDGDRKRVIELYEEWIQENTPLLHSLHELKGKALLCWCDPLPCHASILAEIVEGLYLGRNVECVC